MVLDANGLPIEEVAPATEETPDQGTTRRGRRKAPEVVVLEGNCGGELVQLPDIEGVTYHEYTCKVCGQLVHVGLEDLEANGLPTQHHKREEGN